VVEVTDIDSIGLPDLESVLELVARVRFAVLMTPQIERPYERVGSCSKDLPDAEENQESKQEFRSLHVRCGGAAVLCVVVVS